MKFETSQKITGWQRSPSKFEMADTHQHAQEKGHRCRREVRSKVRSRGINLGLESMRKQVGDVFRTYLPKGQLCPHSILIESLDLSLYSIRLKLEAWSFSNW